MDINRVFKEAKNMGIEDLEIFSQREKKLDISVFNGEIDKYTTAVEKGVSFRGIYNNKMGYAYTEKLEHQSITKILNSIIENSKTLDLNEEYIYEGSKHYKDIGPYKCNLSEIDTKEKIKFVKEMEQYAKALDKRVISVNHCLYSEENTHTEIINTKGLKLNNNGNIGYAYISVMVKEKEDVKTSGKYMVSKNFNNFDGKALAKEAVDEAISMLDASSINSGKYPMVLRGDVVANILEAFSPMFSAENAQKNISLLKDSVGNKIASKLITLVDDPFMEKGILNSSFDSEGVPTKYKKIIDEGVLTTLLHNLKTAKREGIESTGNAYKSNYKDTITISPTNMYIDKGKKELKEIISDMKNGLFIIDVQGLHSGLNPISGDFSLSAYGYEIIDGKIGRPINEITIAGNFINLLLDIEELDNNIMFTLPSGNGYIGSPSIRIKELNISGK
ncbi:TldD/PmbA family protein [Clostridiisalibacter paucivorans]|uniref:TldD/PmbA family protein n=1 Tax=Clostridiisalibacter paucivorans TaxID=408753 RepID=UPI00047A82AD|nr:TldD/PmbA family protein [Clostridiisalibacter paucivorans]